MATETKLCEGASVPKSDTCEREAESPDLPLGPPECEEWPFHLEHWHASQWDPIYALGASGWNEHVTRSICVDALYNLRRDASKNDIRPEGDDRKLPDRDREELQECIDGLEAWLNKNPPPHPSFVGPFCRPGLSGPFYKDRDGWLILRRGPVHELGGFPSRTVLRMRPYGDFATHDQVMLPDGPDHFWGHYFGGDVSICVYGTSEYSLIDSGEANADFEARVAQDVKRN